MAVDALENYMAQSGGAPFLEVEEYNTISLIVSKLTKIVVNVILAGCFRVHGFSSSLVARRVIQEYVVDNKGSGFAANAFLTKAMVKSISNNTDVFQVLTFIRNFLDIRTLSFMVGFTNLICSIVLTLLIVFEGGIVEWYNNSMQHSEARVVVIMAAILIALVIGCSDLML